MCEAPFTAYLAPDRHLQDLLAELGGAAEVHGRLALAEGPPREVAWVANVWKDPRRIAIGSIAEGARQLRALQRNWALYDWQLHRRSALIAERLPHVGAKPLVFPAPAPVAPLGSWTLIDAGTILASPECSSPFANGEARFVENREGPPNRAYLKLWEALTLIGRRPGPGERCLDLGASPGGWSWVLQKLGARVVSVDKAPLAPDVAALPGIAFRQMSAFALEPAEIGPVDWLFSDVVCYPARLLALVRRWLAEGRVGNYLCTIKFQGETDMATARQFAEIPGSRLIHLHSNKHELTWIRLDNKGDRR